MTDMKREQVVGEMREVLQSFPLCVPTYPRTRCLEDETAQRMINAVLARAEELGYGLRSREPSHEMKFAAAHLKGLWVANQHIKPNSTKIWQAMWDAGGKP